MTEINNVKGTQGINAQQQSGGVKKQGEQKKDNNSIFGDKNNNGIVDKNDFDAETAEKALEKGLIGKSWDSVKDSLGKILKSNKKEKGITQEKRFNEQTNETYLAEIKDGREIKRTYYKQDGSIDETLNLQYDENGNISKKVSIDADGNLQYATEIKDNLPVSSIQYNSDGTKSAEFEFDNGNVVGAVAYEDGYIQSEKYDENENVVSRQITYTGDIPLFDGSNGGDIAKSMNNARQKLPIGGPDGSKEFKRVITETFGENLEKVDTYRDGGSLQITLKDGTTIAMNNKMMVGDGSITIQKPDGTTEKYTRDGEKVTE